MLLKHAFLRNHWAVFNHILYVSYKVHENENLLLDAGDMTKMAAILINVENPSVNLLHRNRWADFHKTLVIASRTPANYSLFK